MDYGYLAYRTYKELLKSQEIADFLERAKATSAKDVESLECLKSICRIDSDWVEMIQKKLPFVANAILENRQFVKSEGDVVDIEKVKNVGKESVIDLSRHSNYITRVPQDGKIIPDKLMIPKKDDDFALYENRFLYSLLVYLCQFIEIRLDEIRKLSGKYEGKVELKKKFETKDGKVDFSVYLDEDRLNDPYRIKNSGCDDAISVIESNLSLAKSLLATPLMKIVSKANPVRPPIVQTNIFRFDHNFHESLELYHFLQNYPKKGYEIETVPHKETKFSDRMRQDFSNLIYLTSFLTYLYANDLTEDLEKEYRKEQTRRKEEEDNRTLARLNAIRNALSSSGMDQTEYIALLKDGQKILEKKLLVKDQEGEKLKLNISEEVKRLDEDYDLWKKKEAQDAEESLKKRKDELQERFDREAREKGTSYRLLLQEKEILDQEKGSWEKKYTDVIKNETESLKKECDALKASLEEENRTLKASIEEERRRLEEEKKAFQTEKEKIETELISLRRMNNIPEDVDYTKKENFDLLEKEKKAFDKMYQEAWKNAKKSIRKRLLPLDKEETQKKKKNGKKEK